MPTTTSIADKFEDLVGHDTANTVIVALELAVLEYRELAAQPNPLSAQFARQLAKAEKALALLRGDDE